NQQSNTIRSSRNCERIQKERFLIMLVFSVRKELFFRMLLMFSVRIHTGAVLIQLKFGVKESGKDDKTHASGISPLPLISQKKAKKCSPFPIALRDPKIGNIDMITKILSCAAYMLLISITPCEFMRPNPNFMDTKQHDITQSIRGILVDWLVE
ncbi:hypothetical protein S83_012140, partial [Arachis hypogaea]